MLKKRTNILPRYLRRKALGGCVMALTVLMAIVIALFVAELLGDLADGEILPSTLLALLLLRLPEALLLTAPLALVVGLLMSLGELAQGEEMGAMRAAGISAGRVFLVVLGIAGAWSVALVVVAGWISPWADARSARLAENMAEELLYTRVRAGQFESLGNDRLTIYAQAVERDERRLNEVFLQFRNDDRIEVVTAATGHLVRDPDSALPYLSLTDGVHVGYQADGTGLPLRLIEFARHDIQLPLGTGSAEENPLRAMALHRLLFAGGHDVRIEFQRRLVPAMTSLALAMFALPVCLTGGRGSRFGIALAALAAYLAYANGVQLLLARLELAGTAWPGAWSLHAVAWSVSLAVIIRWWRRW